MTVEKYMKQIEKFKPTFDYCVVCGQDIDKDPKKCCHHIAWSEKW